MQARACMLRASATARPLTASRPAAVPAARRTALAPTVRPAVVVSVVAAAAAASSSAPVVAAAATDDKGASAKARYNRGSAHKLRRVLDVIRGRSYEEALMILEFLPYRAAEPVLATLISAASNAKNNNNASKAKLYVSECFADQAGQLKRFRPRAKGRPFKILKPINHLTIKVAERP